MEQVRLLCLSGPGTNKDVNDSVGRKMCIAQLLKYNVRFSAFAAPR